MLQLSDHLRASLPADSAFEAVLRLDGREFRHHKHRRTVRVDFGGRGYFVKTHGPTSWGEILKNALRARWPVLTSKTEWDAIHALTKLGIPTTPAAGYGVRGTWPHRLESFLVTEALEGMIHLDELTPKLAALPASTRVPLVRALIRQIAMIARKLHTHGLNHRDFYLCHIMICDRNWSQWKPTDNLKLHVIDLHRMQIRRRTPRRLAIKDISGLLFSSFDAGLTFTDWLRFLNIYWGADWRTQWSARRWWRKLVMWRAVTLYRSEHGRLPQLPAGPASSA